MQMGTVLEDERRILTRAEFDRMGAGLCLSVRFKYTVGIAETYYSSRIKAITMLELSVVHHRGGDNVGCLLHIPRVKDCPSSYSLGT